MLNTLIRFSLANRPIILGAMLMVLIGGFYSASNLPVEVLPDLTRPTVTILTECHGLAPEEVEALVTVPMEGALMGVPGLTRLRTTSDVALSMAFVEFEWDTDIYHARRLVQERLQTISGELPDQVTPFMTPVASLMGEIMLVGLSSPSQSVDARELRWIADWSIRRRLQSIPGVAEVLAMGGGVKQIHIRPDPLRMRAYGITFEQLHESAERSVSNTTGGFLSSTQQEIMVRHLAMSSDPQTIGQTVITHDGTRPIHIGDVADVAWDIQPMRGDAAVNNVPGVILSITKSPGFDTIRLTREIENALNELQNSLPGDAILTPLFRQADFINLAMGNLREALELGAVMVVLVLAAFLMNIRTTVITLMAIPLSFASTAIIFQVAGISVNSMTLGGLAVAIGMVVDDSIIDVENVFRRLRENASTANPLPRLQIIADASAEIRNAIFYATMIIIMAFLPLLALSGLEGRLFTPIAVATITSMAASFLVSLTVIPVLSSFLLRPTPGRIHKDNILVRFLKECLRRTWLRLALDYPIVVLAIAGMMLAGAISLYPAMGRDFLPSFREETILLAMTAAPGTSLKKTNELADIAEKQLLSVPEIKNIGRRVGRAERGDHVVPVSTVEFDIDFHSNPDGRDRHTVITEIQEIMRSIPGTFTATSSPLGDRIGHMLSGVSAPVAIKIFGPDLNTIRSIGLQVQEVARSIPGLESARTEQQAPIPQLRIEIDRLRATAYGITPGSLNSQLSTLLGGRKVAEIFQDTRKIDLVIRLDDSWREMPERLKDIYFPTASGVPVRLGTIASFRNASGPNVIQRENTQRRFVVSINPTTDGIDQLVDTLRRKVRESVSLPDGYFITYEGEFEARQSATTRILWISIIAVLIVCLLLYGYFRSGLLAMQVLFDIALALIGGLALTYILTANISIATMVGLIAVAGIGARNSVMLISHYLHLMKVEGQPFSRELVERGTLERLIPILMTAISAGIALIPLLLASDEPGKEILHPVAVVIVGGLFTTTLLGLGVTPAVFFAFGKSAAQNAANFESASQSSQ